MWHPQVLLRWNLQGGKGVITTTTKPSERLPGMLDAMCDATFTLTAEEMAAIDDAGDGMPLRAHWTQVRRAALVTRP